MSADNDATATQSTDLDAYDGLGAAVKAAEAYRDVRPDLTTMDEAALITAAQGGDEAAALELVARHEDQLGRLVRNALVGAAPLADLYQEAMAALLEAVQSYDPEAATESALYTYAHDRIRSNLRAANAAYDPRGCGRTVYQRYWRAMERADGDPEIARRWAELERLSARELEEIAEAGDILAREIVDERYDRWEKSVRRAPDTTPTWEDYAAKPGRGLTGAEFDTVHAAVTYLDASAGHSDRISDPYTSADHAAVVTRLGIAKALDALDDTSREIITRMYGLDGQSPETQRELSLRLGLSRPRVANLARAAYRQLARLV